MPDSQPHNDEPVPQAPPLPDVDSPSPEEVLEDVPSTEEIIEQAESADQILQHQPGVEELIGRTPEEHE